MSRNKGRLGEQQVVLLAKEAGFPQAARNWHEASTGGQINGDILGIADYYVEVRRRERQDFPGWIREVKQAAGNRPWTLVTRRNNEDWLATLPLVDQLNLLAVMRAAEAVVSIWLNSEEPNPPFDDSIADLRDALEARSQ